MSTLFTKPTPAAPRPVKAPRAFTLIEMLVVLAVAALVTAITIGGFNEMRDGNKRTSCQANLTQIYQAGRLYAADEGGKFPFYGSEISAGVYGPADCSNPANNTGIGLWALYTFPIKSGPNAFEEPAALGNALIERYIRHSKVLHCPSHYQALNLYDDTNNDGTPDVFNLDYLSYQACDDGVAGKPPVPPPNGGTATYSSIRDKVVNTPTDNLWPRQLLHFDGNTLVARPPADDTIVTWCPWHRGPRDFDNVLFYDGSVQIIGRNKDSGGVPGLWYRTPKPPV